MTNGSDIAELLRLRRVMIPLTLKQLAEASGVSVSHLGRIERGGRSPSARTLNKIAKPLGFAQGELLNLAGYLPAEPSAAVKTPSVEHLDPYVAAVLSREPVDIQRAVIGIFTILKSVAKEYQSNEFADYVHRKYPEVAEDTITMIKDVLEHPPNCRK